MKRYSLCILLLLILPAYAFCMNRDEAKTVLSNQDLKDATKATNQDLSTLDLLLSADKNILHSTIQSYAANKMCFEQLVFQVLKKLDENANLIEQMKSTQPLKKQKVETLQKERSTLKKTNEDLETQYSALRKAIEENYKRLQELMQKTEILEKKENKS